MGVRPAGDGALDGLDQRGAARYDQPDDAHHRPGQYTLLRTAVLRDCLETADTWFGQHGHAGGTIDRYQLHLQHVQHLLGRTGMGHPGHRMAYMV